MTDEEKFDESCAEFIADCLRLNVRLSVSVCKSLLFDYHQLQEILKLCVHLNEFQKKVRKWKFSGKSDQMDLNF